MRESSLEEHTLPLGQHHRVGVVSVRLSVPELIFWVLERLRIQHHISHDIRSFSISGELMYFQDTDSGGDSVHNPGRYCAWEHPTSYNDQ